MKKGILILAVLAMLFGLLGSQAAPPPGPAAYLVYTGGLFGQLDPCG